MKIKYKGPAYGQECTCGGGVVTTARRFDYKGYERCCAECRSQEISAEELAKKPLFRYSAYWGTWSRVLTLDMVKPVYGPCVEVNLTSIPSCYSSNWEDDVRPIRIRVHGTIPGRNDEFTHFLPDAVLFEMHDNLQDGFLLNRLLHEDFLSQIDWDLYREKSYGGGGVALADCRKHAEHDCSDTEVRNCPLGSDCASSDEYRKKGPYPICEKCGNEYCPVCGTTAWWQCN